VQECLHCDFSYVDGVGGTPKFSQQFFFWAWHPFSS
jgi:hypothetical protein